MRRLVRTLQALSGLQRAGNLHYLRLRTGWNYLTEHLTLLDERRALLVRFLCRITSAFVGSIDAAMPVALYVALNLLHTERPRVYASSGKVYHEPQPMDHSQLVWAIVL